MTAERMMNQEKLCNAINALTDDDAAYLLSRLSENRAFKPVSPRHAAGMMDYEAYKEELARIAARERTMPIRAMILHSGPGTIFGLLAGFCLGAIVAKTLRPRQEEYIGPPPAPQQSPTSAWSEAPEQAGGDSTRGTPDRTAGSPPDGGSARRPDLNHASSPVGEDPSR